MKKSYNVDTALDMLLLGQLDLGKNLKLTILPISAIFRGK